MAAEFKTFQPVEYFKTFLEQNVRPDGRGLWKIRPTSINIGSISTAEGSAIVKLGNTTVVCGIKAELAVPKAEEPKKGFIIPNVELPPLCSSRFRPGPPSEQAQVSSQFVADVIKNSKCILPEDLCISEGKIAWVLYCDLICLDYDGNVLDACIVALISALQNVSLPKVTVNPETDDIHVSSKKSKPLQLHSSPIASTFALFDENILLADPTNEEECLVSGIITIVVMDDDRICDVHKPGGTSIKEAQLQKCIKHAKSRGKEVRSLIQEAISTVDR